MEETGGSLKDGRPTSLHNMKNLNCGNEIWFVFSFVKSLDIRVQDSAAKQ